MRLATGGSGVFAVVTQWGKIESGFDIPVKASQYQGSVEGFRLFPQSSIDMSVASEPGGSESKSGNRLIYISLILPVVASVLICISSTLIAALISSAVVIVTAILVAIDADQHGEIDKFGLPREGAMTLFVGILLLWLLVYPYAFFRRRAFLPPNLGWASIAVSLFFAASPFLRMLLHPITLPACNSPEVIEVLEKALRGTETGPRIRSIDGHKELNYNESESVRYGECVIHLDTEDFSAKYSVTWGDKAQHEFEVRVEPRDLPGCQSSEVVQLLESLVRGTPWGATLTEIREVRDVRYDRNSRVRYGECVARTPQQDIPLSFVVEWINQERGRFQVKIVPAASAPVVL
jgi:hypothetical protein